MATSLVQKRMSIDSFVQSDPSRNKHGQQASSARQIIPSVSSSSNSFNVSQQLSTVSFVKYNINIFASIITRLLCTAMMYILF